MQTEATNTEIPTEAAGIKKWLLARLKAKLADWEALVARLAASDVVALSGTPWVVVSDGFGIRKERRPYGVELVPTALSPVLYGVAGATQMTRAEADRVAGIRGAPYAVVAVRDLPALRVAEIKASIQEIGEM